MGGNVRVHIRRAAVLGAAALMLAVCGRGMPLAAAGDADVETRALQRLLAKAKQQESEITGEDPQLVPDSRILTENRAENDVRIMSFAGQCLKGDGAEKVFYVIGRNYMPEGSILPVIFGQGLEYSCTLEETIRGRNDLYYAVRFALHNTGGFETESSALTGGDSGSDASGPADGDIPALHHWSIGDVVTRTLDGIRYRFRCIDQNYEEGSQKQGQPLALFLCESVIPANTGSEYVYERREDGSYGYVYYPGPVVNFGGNSEYADSPIRSWLAAQEADKEIFPEASVGVEYSCMGRTGRGTFSRFDRSDLRSYRLGSQILTDHYFLLSVDEAVKYREYLWNVNGYGEEESAANAGTFDGAYWLRTPVGNGNGEDNSSVYVVDLVNGNIHPQEVRPQMNGAADGELAVTAPVGVRPAFVLRQRN